MRRFSPPEGVIRISLATAVLTSAISVEDQALR